MTLTMTAKPLCDCHGEAMYWNRDKRSPAGGYWICAEQRRAYYRSRIDSQRETIRSQHRVLHQRNRQVIDAERVKRGNACQDCGAPWEPGPGRFDWHHRDPQTKSFNVTRNTTRSAATVQAELELCDLLCRRCHSARHRRNP